MTKTYAFNFRFTRPAMTANARRLVLRLVRLQNAADAAHDAMIEAYEMDSLFDGGEFSGPAHERQLARDCDRLAQRFGFATYEAAMVAARAMNCVAAMPGWMHAGAFAPLPN